MTPLYTHLIRATLKASGADDLLQKHAMNTEVSSNALVNALVARKKKEEAESVEAIADEFYAASKILDSKVLESVTELRRLRSQVKKVEERLDKLNYVRDYAIETGDVIPMLAEIGSSAVLSQIRLHSSGKAFDKIIQVPKEFVAKWKAAKKAARQQAQSQPVVESAQGT
jgi:hypothetical protein